MHLGRLRLMCLKATALGPDGAANARERTADVLAWACLLVVFEFLAAQSRTALSRATHLLLGARRLMTCQLDGAHRTIAVGAPDDALRTVIAEVAVQQAATNLLRTAPRALNKLLRAHLTVRGQLAERARP